MVAARRFSSLEQSNIYGGILIRAIERLSDGKLFEGPCVSGTSFSRVWLCDYSVTYSCVVHLGETVNQILSHAGVKEVEDLVSLPSFDFEVSNSGAQVMRRNQLYLHFVSDEEAVQYKVRLLGTAVMAEEC